MSPTSTLCYVVCVGGYISFLYGGVVLICSETSLILVAPMYAHTLTVQYILLSWTIAFSLFCATCPWLYWPFCQDMFYKTISTWTMNLPMFYSLSIVYPLLISILTEFCYSTLPSYSIHRAISIIPSGVFFTFLLESSGMFGALRHSILQELTHQD